VIEGSYLAVEAVAVILVVVAVLAALSALVLERADVPARLATRLFWALLLVVWVAVCVVLLLIRNAM
jgi:heme/copper-type cytochrome/quinol oxidase subunit 3